MMPQAQPEAVSCPGDNSALEAGPGPKYLQQGNTHNGHIKRKTQHHI
jgi:hypothetical protein